MKESCYQTLSVAEDAKAVVISAAYKALAKLHHPDSGADKRDWKLMAKINEAFETLSNEEKRAEHDRLLREEREKTAKRIKKQKRLKLAIIPASFLAGLLIAFFLSGNIAPEEKTTSLVAIDSMLAEAKKDLAARENRIIALNDDLVGLEKELAGKEAEIEEINVRYAAEVSEQNLKIAELESRVGLLVLDNQNLASDQEVRNKELDTKVNEPGESNSAQAFIQSSVGSYEYNRNSYLPGKPNQIPADLPPIAIDQFEPIYPDSLKAKIVNGWVELEWIIDIDGKVLRPRVVNSSHQELNQPAIESILRSKWSPARENGEFVARRVTQRIGINSTVENDIDGSQIKELPKEEIQDVDRIAVLENELIKIQETLGKLVEGDFVPFPAPKVNSVEKNVSTLEKIPVKVAKTEIKPNEGIPEHYLARGLADLVANRPIDAYAAFNVGAALGSNEAKQYREFVSRDMSYEDLIEAQKRSEKMFLDVGEN